MGGKTRRNPAWWLVFVVFFVGISWVRLVKACFLGIGLVVGGGFRAGWGGRQFGGGGSEDLHGLFQLQ